MQSKYPCEIVSKHLIPSVRALIAKGLINDHGLTQTNVAKKLGTTQAAISYYISSKRGEKYVKRLENNPQTKSTIVTIINGLAAGTISSNEVMEKMCEMCTYIRKNDNTFI